MRKFFSMAMAAAIFVAASVNTVKADAVNIRTPQQVAIDGSGLQDALNAVTTTGDFFDVTTEQDPFALFSSTASGGAFTTFIIEVVDFGASSNEFGVYDSFSGTKVKIFDGSDTGGTQKIVTFLANGGIQINFVDVAPAGSFATGPGSFGFYVDVFDAPGGAAGLDYTVFTEDSKNAGGAAQALVFQGDSSLDMAILPFAGGPFTSNEFVFAFETDTLVGLKDFDDLVVIVESIVPVPAPGAVLLGAMGLGLVGWVRKRIG